jgi:hypothetical protein
MVAVRRGTSESSSALPTCSSTSAQHKPTQIAVQSQENEVHDFSILPRRKAGQSNSTDRSPVLLTKMVLEKYFGMPLIMASKELVR